jgi:hypothetical protein
MRSFFYHLEISLPWCVFPFLVPIAIPEGIEDMRQHHNQTQKSCLKWVLDSGNAIGGGVILQNIFYDINRHLCNSSRVVFPKTLVIYLTKNLHTGTSVHRVLRSILETLSCPKMSGAISMLSVHGCSVDQNEKMTLLNDRVAQSRHYCGEIPGRCHRPNLPKQCSFLHFDTRPKELETNTEQ